MHYENLLDFSLYVLAYHEKFVHVCPLFDIQNNSTDFNLKLI